MLVEKLSAVMHLLELKYFSENFKTTFWPIEVSFLPRLRGYGLV
jgi:hypothetical protein